MLGGMRNFIGAVLAAAAVAPAVGAQGTVPGWYIETRVTSRYEGDRAAAMPRPTQHVERTWRAGANSRSEGRPLRLDSSAGSYRLTRAGDPNSYEVFPDTRTLRVADRAGMRRAFGTTLSRPNEGGYRHRAIGDGGVILGHHTTKFESRIKLPIIGLAAPSEAESWYVETSWIATDTADPQVAAWIRESRLVAKDSTRSPPDGTVPGMVLRWESRSDRTAGVPHATISEVTEWRTEQMDTARFSLPTGYARVDLASQMRALQRRTAEMKERGAATQRNLEELRRLKASTLPADQAKLHRLMDSTLAAIQREQALHPVNLRDLPNSVTITDSSHRRKKP